MRDEYQTFQEAGAEVIALAVASLSTIDGGVRQTINPPFPLLADPEHEVTEAFNVFNVLGDELAAPSVFVIDTDSTIVWSHVGQSSGDRPSMNTILRHIP